MNSKLYEVISDYLEDNSKDELLDEVNKIITILSAEDNYVNSRISPIGLKFELNTTSWQVLKANANGYYIVERQDEEDPDKYYIRNLVTGKVYSTDDRFLDYIFSHSKCQDYKFIYIGEWGDYDSISIG